MRTLPLFAILIAASLPLAAQVPASRKAAPNNSRSTSVTDSPASRTGSAKTAPARPSASGLPAGAEKIDDFSWRATDEKGVAWIYRKNPFGFSKVREDEANKPAKILTAPADVRVSEIADGKYQFERTGPWGTQKWTKAATDLTDEETQWVKKGQEAAKQ